MTEKVLSFPGITPPAEGDDGIAALVQGILDERPEAAIAITSTKGVLAMRSNVDDSAQLLLMLELAKSFLLDKVSGR